MNYLHTEDKIIKTCCVPVESLVVNVLGRQMLEGRLDHRKSHACNEWS